LIDDDSLWGRNRTQAGNRTKTDEHCPDNNDGNGLLEWHFFRLL
jgi:hypothetical protein